ncbi:hypothetical protein [Parafrankia sp. FMc2]|uniref:hypothetical protein n=1 Tax=Parafrankia sp. FMc2 TaxID=3233196 RepID=UPI0034D45384
MTWEMTSRERRMAAAGAFSDVVGKLLLPHTDIYDALSDESVKALDQLASAVYAAAEALLDRDTRANYAAAGIEDQAPDLRPEISAEDAELLAEVADTMFTNAVGRGCQERTAARVAEQAA